MRQHGRTDTNQAEIVDALRAAGCGVISMSSLGCGIPDLLVWSPMTEKYTLLEVKNQDGKLTAAELEFFASWPGDKCIVRSVEQALNLIGRI